VRFVFEPDDGEPKWQTVVWFGPRLIVALVYVTIVLVLAPLAAPAVACERAERAADYYRDRGEELAYIVWRSLYVFWLVVMLAGLAAAAFDALALIAWLL
jgi:hypothetical protein